MTLNVDNTNLPHAEDGQPARVHHWTNSATSNSQTPLAQARRRRSFARNKVTKAQARLDQLQHEFELAQSEVDGIEALVAKGVRGLN